MGSKEPSEAGLQQNSQADKLVDKDVYTPAEEHTLERSKTFLFGVCKQCRLPIRYPCIKLPVSCTEVRETNIINTYDVEYCDMHVSCAIKYLISNAPSFVSIKTTVEFKRPIYERLFSRFIKKVSSTFEIDTPRRITNVK